MRHPLFGQVLSASQFRRVDGVVFLVVELPDGSPGTIRADATSLCSDVEEPAGSAGVVLDAEGLRVLRALVVRLRDERGLGEGK